MNNRSLLTTTTATLICLAAGGQARADGGSWLDTFNPRAADRKDARTLAPRSLDKMTQGSPATATADGQARPIKLRVYADDDYRAAVLHWQSKLRAQVERINRVVGPLFNVAFEIDSLRPWNRSHAGLGFEPMLTELDALDPARDVDWVLGLVTSFKGVATSIHQVGGARLLSRHFIMRGMDDNDESRALAQRLGSLPIDEREALYRQRKEHKQLVIFLHEWAHSMGALHVEDAAQIMNPSYDTKQAWFTDFQRRLIGLVLDRRLADRTTSYPESAALQPVLAEMPPNEGMDSEGGALVALAQRRAHSHADVVPAGGTATADAPARPDELRALLDAGIRDVVADDLAAATPRVLEAARRLAAGEPIAPLEALQLAQLASHVGALTIADRALARADSKTEKARSVAAAVMTIRWQIGLPQRSEDLGLTAEQEPAYVGAYREIALLAVQPDKKRIYRQRLDAFAVQYPNLPGTKVLQCENDLRAGRITTAEKNCQSAVKIDDEAIRGHYLLGVLYARSGRSTDAERALRRALLLDPEDSAVWRELTHLYEQTHNTIKLHQLDGERQALATARQPP